MAYFECTTGMGAGGGATITVTYNSSFYNKTMTCSNGTKTYTKTTTSSGSTEFKVSDEGTWTITCNGVSRTVYVTLNYTTQMAVTKTITLYGANEDYITFTDATGSKVCQFASGQTSKSVSITFTLPSQNITFTSTVAKNPNNLSANYSKTVAISDSTTSISIMPDNVLYWYGNNKANFSTTSYSFYTGANRTVSINTHDITITCATVVDGPAVGSDTTSDLNSLPKLHWVYTSNITTSNFTGIAVLTNKGYVYNPNSPTGINNGEAFMPVTSGTHYAVHSPTSRGNKYIAVFSNEHSVTTVKIHAIWLSAA